MPVIGVGGVVNKEDAELALASGFDLVAIGKACIAYPDWADRIIKTSTWICTSTAPNAKR